MDILVKTLVDNSQKTLKNLKEEILDNDEIINFVSEIRILFKEDRYKKDSIKDFKKDYPDKNEELEGTLLNYIGEKDVKIMKTEIPDSKWKYLTKI